MNRKAEIFFDAITLLREDLVEEAQRYVFRKKASGWKKFASLAACMLLVVSLGALAILPRGCGASGGNGMNDSAAPTSPAEAPPATNEDELYGDGSGGTDTAPAPPSGEPAPAPEESAVWFTAQVLEVLEDGLLVEPFDRLPGDPEYVRVPTAGLEILPPFYPGGIVQVFCGEILLEDGEAVAADVAAVWLTEP